MSCEPYRVLVTGSRTWDDKDFIWNVLDTVLSELGDVTVVHGACPKGADAIAQGWVRHKLVHDRHAAVRAERHPADWQQHGRTAGFKRNEAMVRLGADVCFAFLAECSKPGCPKRKPHASHGGEHCADLAARAGIRVLRYARAAGGNSLADSAYPSGPGVRL